MKRSFFLLSLIGIMLFLFSQALLAGGEYRDPDVLIFARTADERASVTAERYEALINHIAQVTGKSISYYLTTSYAAVIEALDGGFLDMAEIAPAAYVMAKERVPNFEAMATRFGIPDEAFGVPGGTGYTAVLITKKDSGFDSIESLKGATIGFADPASTSSYLVPYVVFTRDVLGGESLSSYFGEEVFVGSHDAVIYGILEGRIDGGFIFDAAPRRLYQAGELDKPMDLLNFLWYSPPVPRDPFAVKEDLHPDLRAKILKALLTFHENPTSADYFRIMGATHYTEVSDADYDIIRDLRDAMDN